MLRLSELSGFLVGGNLFRKTMAKSRQKNRNRKHFSIKTMGRGYLGEWLRVGRIYGCSSSISHKKNCVS